MIERWLRKPYQILCVDRLAQRLSLHPLWITLLAALTGIAAALLIHQTFFCISLLLLSGYLDTLDGTLARLHGKTSPVGTVFDIVSDRLVEAAIIISLFFLDPSRAFLTLAMMTSVLICITSFLVVGIFSENTTQKGFHYSPGLIERPEAFCFFILMILFPSFFTPLAITFTSAVLLTAFLRLYRFAFIFLDQ